MNNLEKLLEKATSKNSYVACMEELSTQGASFKCLDKFHYMCNEKLGMDANFFAEQRQSVGEAVYCPECGNYLGHPVYCVDDWLLVFTHKNKEGLEVYETHEIAEGKEGHYSSSQFNCCCGWEEE